MSDNITVNVTSEIGDLKQVLIHSPDGGIGNVPTCKIHDWLYDDIVDVEQMQKEYNYFVRVLLLFLDIEKLFKKDKFSPNVEFNPGISEYFSSKNVIEAQYCLAHIFSNHKEVTRELISSISAIEGLNIDQKRNLLYLYEAARSRKTARSAELPNIMDLVKTLITGKLEWKWDKKRLKLKKLKPSDVEYIFPPIANFIFTRDTGVTIKHCVFITKPRFYIRKREVVLLKFIAEYHLLKGEDVRIIEIGEDVDHFQIEDKVKDDTRVSFEGGDIMMISKDHILIGCSERTSPYAIHKFIHRVFKETLATTVTVIKISEKRSQMHIDTVLSHLRRDAWIMFGQLSERWQNEKKEKGSYLFEYADSIRQKSRNELKKEKLVTLTQFYCPYGKYDEKENYQVYANAEADLMEKRGEIPEGRKIQSYKSLASDGFGYHEPEGLEDLLRQISVVDFGVESKKDVDVIYSGGGVSPHDEREQWTDACNLLVIKEGIAVGYDRNRKTAASFEHLMLGFKTGETPSKTSIKAARKRKLASMSEDRKNFLKWNLEQRKKGEKSHLEISDLDFHLIYAKDLIDYFEAKLQKNDIKEFIKEMANTLILLPSNELSRARGGSHCMSMPLWRENINR